MMKKLLIIIFCLILQSCIGIPVGTSIRSTERLGERFNESSEVVSFVEKRETNKWTYYVVSPEGSGKSLTIYTDYFIFEDGHYNKINHIKFAVPLESLADREYIDIFLPILDTRQWLAFHVLDSRSDYYDIEMVLFDKNRVIHKETIQRCFRMYDCPSSLKNYSIFPIRNNKQILFKTIDGDFVFDTGERAFVNFKAKQSLQSDGANSSVDFPD